MIVRVHLNRKIMIKGRFVDVLEAKDFELTKNQSVLKVFTEATGERWEIPLNNVLLITYED